MAFPEDLAFFSGSFQNLWLDTWEVTDLFIACYTSLESIYTTKGKWSAILFVCKAFVCNLICLQKIFLLPFPSVQYEADGQIPW